MKDVVISKSVTLRDTRSLNSYFTEINSIPLLTMDEEFELGMQAYDGDEEARQKLVKHNLRFVVSVAKQFTGKGVRFEDLINEGNIGLIEASQRFDPTRGFKFISYAVWYIRRYLLTYIRGNANTIRFPMNKLTKNGSIRRELALLEQQLERTPSYDEMVEALSENFTKEQIAFYTNDIENMTKALEAPIGFEEGSISLLDVVVGTEPDEANFIINEHDSEIRKDTLLRKLSVTEQDILTLVYGLDGNEPLSLKETAKIIGVSASRIGVVRDNALRKLKYQLRNSGSWLKQI